MNYESYLDLMKGSFTIVILAICSIFALKVVIEKYIVFQGIKERYINGFSLRVRQSLKGGGLAERNGCYGCREPQVVMVPDKESA